jgi:type II secretory ATPase GspE/PulE/Tfp pilus assembly ATPase PilB-like protein
VDGVLVSINQYPPRESSAMIKRVKILANMDIAQELVTQGGRISLKVGGQELDLRVSLIPVPGGEGVVMRLLKKGAFNLTLQDLGFEQDTQEQFERLLSQPYGMLLSCGPTGSGKTTTLYASLKKVQRPDRKLLTVEDPIEYQMPLIQQVQVNMAPHEPEKRVTFARSLREFLRQDPDVILVGEIRDVETAQVSVQASLTGHLLLSTLHTNDSVGIIARLRDMGIEPFLIGATLLGGLAQRLARKICPDCRVQFDPPPEVAELLAREGFPEAKLTKGTGCNTCHGTGYKGRTGLYELLEITPEIRELINRAAPEEEIRKVALAQGFRVLFRDGIRKVARGVTTLEEVQRVAKNL